MLSCLRCGLAASAAALLMTISASGQAVTFSTTTYASNNLWSSTEGPNGHIRVDLNGDGREDFVSRNDGSWASGCGSGSDFAVSLSTGDGTYAAPVCTQIPDGTALLFATGDFFAIGTMDVVVTNDVGEAFVYKNDGTGKLTLTTTVTLESEASGIVAADVNHDGRLDLVYDTVDANGSGPSSLHVLLGFGDGTFATGPTTSFTPPNQSVGALVIGDFDNDSHVDVLATSQLQAKPQIFYGDGQGNFTAGPILSGATAQYRAADVLSTGTMDLIGAPFQVNSDGTNTYFNYLDLEWGHYDRQLTSQQIPLKSCTLGGAPPAVADFNGDGKNDIVVAEAADCNGGGPYTLNVLLGNGDGTFQPEQAIYQTNDQITEWDVLRASHSSKPDLTVWQSEVSQRQLLNPEELVLVNTTAGSFPTCTPLNFRPTQINVCSPTSMTGSNSPVTFSFAANNQTPGRDMEIWVDGQKLKENLANTYSYYSFVQASLALSNGPHAVAIYSVGWDYSILETQFTLYVGSTTCPAPGSDGLTVCSPLSDATLTGPVLAQASGQMSAGILRMEVWVDGVKEYSTFGSPNLETKLNLAPGWHQFAYYIVDVNGAKQSVIYYAAVQ